MRKKFPKKHLPPIEIILERLDYDSIKGKFYWKINMLRNGIKKGDLVKGFKKRSHKNVYLYISINRNQYAAQRLAWYIFYKKDPYPLDVHHKNNNTLDNRIDNLELLSLEENNKYKTKYKNNKSGYTGIRKTPEGKIRANIYHQGKQINVGTFFTEEEALQAQTKLKKNINDKKSHS